MNTNANITYIVTDIIPISAIYIRLILFDVQPHSMNIAVCLARDLIMYLKSIARFIAEALATATDINITEL